MRGDYSLERLRWAKKDDLGPEANARLEKFRVTKRRWREATSRHSPGVIGATLDAWKEFTGSLTELQLDPRFCVFSGRSAGGHLAMLAVSLSLQTKHLQQAVRAEW